MLNKTELSSAKARAFAAGVANANTLTSIDFEPTGAHHAYYEQEDELPAEDMNNQDAVIASNPPKQDKFVGTVKHIGRMLPSKTSAGKFFCWVTFATDKGDKAFVVAEGFLLANEKQFVKGVTLSVTYDHTIDGKTTYTREGVVYAHTFTGESIANCIDVTDVEKKILERAIMADSLGATVRTVQGAISHIDSNTNATEYNAMAQLCASLLK